MLIEFKKIGEEGLRVERVLDLDPVPPDREVLEMGPAAVRVVVREDARGVVLEGDFDVEVTLVCARCLERFGQSVAGQFTAVYRYPPGERPEEAEVADADLDLSYLEPEQESLDLREVIREQIYLNLPMKPLHDPGCKGLCPRCGADRNKTTCDCPSRAPDPRWEGLARLKARTQRD